MLSCVTGKGSNIAKRPRNTKMRAAVSVSSVLLLAVAFVGVQAARATGGQASTSAAGTVTVPAGTRLMVTMVNAVDSDTSQPGQRFRGTLETNLMAGDVVAAPKGTTVFGRLLTAESSGGRSGGQLEFDLTDIVINGQTHSLATSSNQLQGEGSGTQAATGAKAGAAIGAIAGGLGGAMRGAGVGAVAGHTSSGNTRGEKVKVPAGALVEFNLDHPVSLPATAR
jgi:hypothetical protein